MDLCGEHTKEIRVLHMTLESGVPQKLLSSKDIPYKVVHSRLAQKLVNEYALAEDAALWSVETWAYALELKNTLPGTPGEKLTEQDESIRREKQPVSTSTEPIIDKPAPRNTKLGAVYYIDHIKGNIPLGDLPVGARVVDPSWEWKFRTGNNYTSEAGDETKPVTWLVMAKNHYSGLGPHVTMLSQKLIGSRDFYNKKNWFRGIVVSNHWGEGGEGNASHGLRSWLNSTGNHSDEGFYRAFSKNFKQAVLKTSVPNKDWKNGSAYSTSDNVFIPSTTELGDTEHRDTYPIGTAYAYFQGANEVKRVAVLGGNTRWYWTRSPVPGYGTSVRTVSGAGEFYHDIATYPNRGVRPALNLKSEILVSEIKN